MEDVVVEEAPKEEVVEVEAVVESEVVESPVKPKKTSSKKKRLSMGKKSKKDSSLPAPPTEGASEAPFMPPAPPATTGATKTVSAVPRPRLNKAAQLMMEARQKAKKAIEDEQKLEANKDAYKMIYNTYVNTKPRPTLTNMAQVITAKRSSLP